MSHLSRRNFITMTCYTLAGTSLMFIPSQSQAIWPFIGRILFKKALKNLFKKPPIRNTPRAPQRYSPSTISSVKRYDKPHSNQPSRRYNNFIDIGDVIDIVSFTKDIISISPSAHANIQKHNCQVIWLEDDVDNNFELEINNFSDHREICNVGYQLVDVNSKRIEVEDNIATIIADPHENYSHPCNVGKLPNDGVKFLQGITDSNNLIIEPSANILVTTTEDIRYGHK